MFCLEKKSKPILKWAGGKSGLLPQLVEYFPNRFSRYIEPFFGGGAIFFALDDAIPALVNDVNSELTECYEVVRDFPEELMAQLNELSESYSESFYYELRSLQPDSKVQRAARTIFLNKTGFNGLYRQNSQGKFNVPFGKRLKCPKLFEKENMLRISSKLRKVTFQNSDFELALAQAGSGDFVYCDPPYEPLSLTSSFNTYCGDGFDFEEQRRLKQAAEDAHSRGATVAISNSSSPRILELYSQHQVNRVLAKRAINSKGAGRGSVEELLIVMPQLNK